MTAKEFSDCDNDDGNDSEEDDWICDVAARSESWLLFSLLLAADVAGKKPRETTDAVELSGDLCGVDPRDDELPSVGCLDAGEWLGVDLRDTEDSAADE